jgi:hypothetical protein
MHRPRGGVMRGTRRRGDAVLKLYRAAGGDNGCREQGGDVTYSCPKRARGRGASCSADRATGCRGAAAGCRAAACPKTEHLGQHPKRAQGRRECGELAADTAHVAPELAAAGAVAHVAPGSSPRANAAIVSEHQFGANLRACRIASLHRLDETDTCPHKKRFDRRYGDGERAGHLGVAHPAQLPHQQGGALLVREAPDIPNQATERLALVGVSDRVVHRRAEIDAFGGRHGSAQLVDAAVVRYPVKPGTQCQFAVAGAQPRVCAKEHILERVLGVLAPGEHLPRVRKQPGPVPVVNRAEGLVLAGPEQRDELLVGAQPQKRRSNSSPRWG